MTTPNPPRKGFKLIPCPGEAHGNAHIDNCMQCAPRWGEIEVPIEVTLRLTHEQALEVALVLLGDPPAMHAFRHWELADVIRSKAMGRKPQQTSKPRK